MLLTFFSVQASWTLFRSPDLRTAGLLGQSLVGANGISVPISLTWWVDALAPYVRPEGLFPNIFTTPSILLVFGLSSWAALSGPFLLGWLGITAEDVTAGSPLLDRGLATTKRMPSYWKLGLASLMFAVSLAALSRSSPFLYFQF